MMNLRSDKVMEWEHIGKCLIHREIDDSGWIVES